jgi:recombination protein RecT
MANETNVIKQERPIDIMKSMINAPSVQAQFQNALGNHKDAFVASLIDLYTGDKQLQVCKPADVIAQALKAATLNLPINKALGFAYILVFKNWDKERKVAVPTPTFVPGYKGYIQLAMRTGQYRTINADVVYEGELRKGSKLTGEITLDGEKKSDKIVGYFCYFELINGFNKTLYMSVEEMAKYALRYSPSFRTKNPPSLETLIKAAQSEQVGEVGWNGNFTDMAIKTVIRKLLGKYGYLSVEMQTAMANDNEDAQEQRNEAIAEIGNQKALPIEDVTYESVDTETGEVKQAPQPQPKPTPNQAPQPSANNAENPPY